MKENEGEFDFLALVLKFGFEGVVTTAFCKMRWLVLVREKRMRIMVKYLCQKFGFGII